MAEIKVCMGLFQIFSKVYIPYFNICSFPKIINETINLSKLVITACIKAVEKVPHTVLINHSIDGIS